MNRAAARQLADMGVGRVTLSTEDVRANLAALLGRLGPAAAVVVYEDSPLFISESCPYANLAGGCPGPGRLHLRVDGAHLAPTAARRWW